MDHFVSFFNQNGFMPHGHCYLWKPTLLWTHFTSDFLIGLAYLSISLSLYVLVKRIRLPFSPVFIAFGIFIAACGLTHFMAVWNLWHADYWTSGLVKVVTAFASVFTGVALFPLKPKVIAFAESARLSEERRLELEAKNQELKKLYEKVQETNTLKTQFFANVSHELRTPLALILGPLEEILKEDKLTATQEKNIDVAIRNSKTLLKHVNDLLDISKLEAGKMEPKYSTIDLIKLLNFVSAHFETVMQTKNIFFSIQGPESLMADVDGEKIQRVFMNLLSNAIKFTPEGGRIRVHIREDGNQAVVVFEDTGPGIKQELKDLIFERFRQLDGGADRKTGGTGLGLAIVKDFVEMHLGQVELIQGQTSGATFKVSLPLKAPQRKSSQSEPMEHLIDSLMLDATISQLSPLETEDQNPYRPTHLKTTKAPTVLVCEDNPDMNRFIAESIAAEGASVYTSPDGKAGLEKAKKVVPDLIISDIMMPHMSGDQLVRELKADRSLSDIPVLLLSARADDEMRINLLKEGANDYIIKPFSAEELRVRAKNLLAMKQAKDLLKAEVEISSANILDLVNALSEEKKKIKEALNTATLARKEAEKANQVKSIFLNLVSHELNTPLMAMTLTVQLFDQNERKNLSDSQKKLLNLLINSSTQMKTLVEGLLQYIKTGSHTKNNSVTINIEEFTHNIVQEFKGLATHKGLDLKLNLEQKEMSFKTDKTKLRIIIQNLIVNAIKFTQQGHVELFAGLKDNKLIIKVIDTGPGIEPEDRKRIFQPFEQVEAIEHKTIPGIGLGLALVMELIKDLDGEIHLESEVGKGSVFTVEIG